MRGNLTQKEPVMIKKWQDEKLYEKMNENREGCTEYLLHDGPPYANGDIHCGHMLNRLLKDFVIRYQNMKGHKTPLFSAGTPMASRSRSNSPRAASTARAMSVPEFRNLCRDYAYKQVDRSKKPRSSAWAALGDYDHPYLTLMPEFEAREIDVFAAMALKGLIYKGLKPVYWSPSSESALAEAEVEYQDVLAKTMYVSFDVADGKGLLPSDAKIVIWTTTPWTIPGRFGPHGQPVIRVWLIRHEPGQTRLLALA
jgi:isoleucyl-tRNA synthetase